MTGREDLEDAAAREAARVYGCTLKEWRERTYLASLVVLSPQQVETTSKDLSLDVVIAKLARGALVRTLSQQTGISELVLRRIAKTHGITPRRERADRPRRTG